MVTVLSLQLQEQDLLKQYQEDQPLRPEHRKEIQLVQAYLKEQETKISGKVRTGTRLPRRVEK